MERKIKDNPTAMVQVFREEAAEQGGIAVEPKISPDELAELLEKSQQAEVLRAHRVISNLP